MFHLFHVTFGTSKKVLKISSEKISWKQVTEEMKSAFSIVHDVIIQTFDSECGEFVDVDINEEDVPERAKLCVEINQTVNIPSFMLDSSLSSASSSDGSIGEVSEVPVGTSDTTSCLDASKDLEACSSQSFSEVTVQEQKKDVDIKQWPYPFELKPSMFPAKLWETQSRQEKLSKTQQSHLLNGIYDLAVRYTLYPQPHQYDSMVPAILVTFPYLGRGMAGVDARGLWKSRLRDKFMNSRKRYETSNPEVVRRKLKKETRDQDKDINVWGVKHFSPDVLPGEDKISQEAHLKAMQTQVKKKKDRQDNVAINIALEKTFPLRRKEILGRGGIEALKKKYPVLFCGEQIIAEFFRVTEVNLQEKFVTGMSKIAPMLLKMKTPKKIAEWVNNIPEDTQDNKNDSLLPS